MLGIDAPTSMEGRPFSVRDTDASFGTRRAFLVQANVDAMFRDGLVTTSQAVYVVLAVLVAAGVAVLSWTNRHRRALRYGALLLLGFPTVTYLSAPLHLATNGGAAAFWAFVAVASVGFVGLCEFVGRRSTLGPLLCALSLVVGIHLVDAFTAVHLEFNTPFGYSATVGIRLAGIGNPTFAQLAAAAVVLAGFVAARTRKHATGLAVALLGVTLVALIPPIFGQSFGATLAATPAFVLFAWLVVGRQVRARHVGALAVLLVASGLTVGFLDLLRPANQRTHVGRFFEQVGNEGWSGFEIVIHRKASLNFETFSNTGWVVLIVAALALLAWLWWGPTRASHQPRNVSPAVRATVAGLATLMVLGYVFKDSGIAVPALMLGVTIAVLAFVVPDPTHDTAAPDTPAPDTRAIPVPDRTLTSTTAP